MRKGERIQWACGHWFVAGMYGVQDEYAKNVTKRRCGECTRRLQDAAPDLLAALEEIITEPTGQTFALRQIARAAIKKAKLPA